MQIVLCLIHNKPCEKITKCLRIKRSQITRYKMQLQARVSVSFPFHPFVPCCGLEISLVNPVSTIPSHIIFGIFSKRFYYEMSAISKNHTQAWSRFHSLNTYLLNDVLQKKVASRRSSWFLFPQQGPYSLTLSLTKTSLTHLGF